MSMYYRLVWYINSYGMKSFKLYRNYLKIILITNGSELRKLSPFDIDIEIRIWKCILAVSGVIQNHLFCVFVICTFLMTYKLWVYSIKWNFSRNQLDEFVWYMRFEHFNHLKNDRIEKMISKELFLNILSHNVAWQLPPLNEH